jgi:hypothetical protein
MQKFPRPRVPLLVFSAGIATALTFGASSVVAAPRTETGEQFFCGFTLSYDHCVRCCGRYVADWHGSECYCGPDTNS